LQVISPVLLKNLAHFTSIHVRFFFSPRWISRYFALLSRPLFGYTTRGRSLNFPAFPSTLVICLNQVFFWPFYPTKFLTLRIVEFAFHQAAAVLILALPAETFPNFEGEETNFILSGLYYYPMFFPTLVRVSRLCGTYLLASSRNERLRVLPIPAKVKVPLGRFW